VIVDAFLLHVCEDRLDIGLASLSERDHGILMIVSVEPVNARAA
jgi:hypothetical protein